MSKPFNLDAVAAEATGEPFRFTFGGETYEMPPAVDLRVITALDAGRLEEVMERLLGADQWAKLVKSPVVLDHVRFKVLISEYMHHTGLDEGEAAASTGS